MSNKREVVAVVRAEIAELEDRLSILRLALAGLTGKTDGTVTRRSSPAAPYNRNREAVQAEITRVLSVSGGGPLTASEIHSKGDFTCTTGGVYSAARDLPGVRLEKKGRIVTFFLPRELRIRAGEGVIPKGK